jgi:RNA polymerase sigma-70 factor (ECF subfamily)
VPPQQGAYVCTALEEFFRKNYRNLLTITMYAGATQEEAKDAANGAMEDLVANWDRPEDPIRDPLKWARKAAISHFLQEKTRGMDRDRHRMVQKGAGTPDGGHDEEVLLWENRRWVEQILEALPPKQREAMTLITEGFKPAEIAALLGRTPGAVRQNLLEARRRLRAEMPQKFVSEANEHVTTPPGHPQRGLNDYP